MTQVRRIGNPEITPYYEDDWLTLYHASCYRSMPKFTFEPTDVVVTDPPYGTGSFVRQTGSDGTPSGTLSTRFQKYEWDNGGVSWMDTVNVDGFLIFWGAEKTFELLQRATALGYSKHRQLFIRKPNPKPGQEGRVSWSMEPVWVLSKEGFVLYGKTDFFEGAMPRKGREREGLGHPYQKSIAMMTWLLSMLAGKYTRIIDPFAGSGTTFVAARRLGLKCVLWETSRVWCDMIVERARTIEIPLVTQNEQRAVLPGFES